MSNSWHIYFCPPAGHPRLLKTVNTPAQARKNEFYYPSVTGVIKIVDGELSVKDKELGYTRYDHAHFYRSGKAGLSYDEAKDTLYGTRTCPETGEEISSSDFGTRAHAAIEDYFTDPDQVPNSYSSTVNETLRYLNTHFAYRYTEKILCCHDLKIAGTVDYIGQDNFGKWMLADFKFRDVKEGTKATPYDKDRAQLAIEAEMWKNDLGLDYDPDIYSIIVDVNTGTPHVTKHSEKMRRKGLQLARVAAYVYWNLPGYGYVENTKSSHATEE